MYALFELNIGLPQLPCILPQPLSHAHEQDLHVDIHLLRAILSRFCAHWLHKVGDRARMNTPAADVTALRMRFPKDRQFVFDVEYSYRVDGEFTDFSQVSVTVEEYHPVTIVSAFRLKHGNIILCSRPSHRRQHRMSLSTSCA